MSKRTLITQRRYFGVDALTLRAAAGRVLARVAGLPSDRARVTDTHIQQDFGLNTRAGRSLASMMVAGGLLAPEAGTIGKYSLTHGFAELASARVVDPLSRTRARHIVAQGCGLATRINAQWTRIPFEIEAVAPFGAYLMRTPLLAELPLGIVIRARPATRRARWRMASEEDGTHEIRAAFCALSTFVHIGLYLELSQVPRPFCVAFQAEPLD